MGGLCGMKHGVFIMAKWSISRFKMKVLGKCNRAADQTLMGVDVALGGDNIVCVAASQYIFAIYAAVTVREPHGKRVQGA